MTTDDYSIRTWQSEDGLPSDTIYSIVQTPDGFLWVGTLSGLARFDGVHFSVVREPADLANQRIARLFVDRLGELWISTTSGRLAHYSGGRFELFPTDRGLPMQPVNSFAQDRDGSLVLAMESGVYRVAKGSCLPVQSEPAVGNSSCELAVDFWGDQSIWARTSKGVGVVRGQTLTARPRLESPMPGRLGTLSPRHAGGVWMFASEKRLELLRNGRWPAETRPYPNFMDPSVLLEDSSGVLWFGTSQQGLGRLASDVGVARFYQGTGFPTDAINCLFEDRAGNIWVGGNGGGLIRLMRRKFSTFPALAEMGNTSPLCLLEDPQGTLWLAFGEKGLYRLEQGKLTGPVTLAGHPMQYSVWPMSVGGEDRIWFGAYASGVFLLSGETSKAWTLKDGLPSSDLRALYEAPDGSLWIGTERGLCRFDGTNFVDITQRDGLPRAAVQTVTEDASSNLWVGTLTGELVRWKDRKVRVFSLTNGLPGQAVQSLLADPDGSLWVGTMGGGLCWLRNDRFFRFDERTGLPVDDIVGIVDDRLGYLWLASTRGVVRASRLDLAAVAEGRQARLKVKSFDRSDGLPSSRVATGNPCAVRLKDGRLCFATLGGVAVVDPREPGVEQSSPRVVIEAVLVDGQSQRKLNPGECLMVSGGARRIEFHYTAPNLSTPERVHFRHRIQGLNEPWQDAGTERSVSYHGLRPGNYRFEVMATIEPGTEQGQSADLAFQVKPLLFETTWFRAGLFLSLALVVGTVFRVRVGVLEQKRAAQEHFSGQLMAQQEAERKRIAAELHDSLGQSLSIIQNHAVLAQNQSDVGAHVAGISEAAIEALASVRDICHGLRPVELDRLGLSKTLRGMAERFAASSELQILAEIDPIDAQVATEDWIHVLRFVQEAFNNIVKHANAARVKISLREDDDCLRLVISDDGCGFDPVAARGRSLGLSTMEERARMLGAKLAIESFTGKGTTLRLDLPVGVPPWWAGKVQE